MTKLLKLLLIQHFSHPENIDQLPLRSKLWTQGDSTKLLIDSVYHWTPGQTQKRPCLLIKAGDVKSRRIGIGNLESTPAGGQSTYAKVAQGSHIIHCLAVEEEEVELLAAEVFCFLMYYGPVLRQSLNLLRLDVGQIGAPAPVKEYQDMLFVPVQLEYGWNDSWKMEQQAPPLQEIRFSSLFSPFSA